MGFQYMRTHFWFGRKRLKNKISSLLDQSNYSSVSFRTKVRFHSCFPFREQSTRKHESYHHRSNVHTVLSHVVVWANTRRPQQVPRWRARALAANWVVFIHHAARPDLTKRSRWEKSWTKQAYTRGFRWNPETFKRIWIFCNSVVAVRWPMVPKAYVCPKTITD